MLFLKKAGSGLLVNAIMESVSTRRMVNICLISTLMVGGREQDLAYQVAQAEVNNLNSELTRLSTSATALLTESTEESSTLDYIAVGTPSASVPSIPDRIRSRDAILLGGILGICGAWVVLNFKWLAKGMPSPATRRDEETA